MPHRETHWEKERDVRGMQRASESTAGRDFQFRQLVGILHRRIWLIFAIMALGTVLCAFVALLVPPKYTAIAQLVVEPQRAGPAGERASMASPTEESIDTHVTLVGSRDHLQRVVEVLAQDPELRTAVPQAGKHWATAAGSVSDGPGHLVLSGQPAAPIAAEAKAWSLSQLEQRLKIWSSALLGSGHATTPHLEELERGIRVNQERRSRVISVAFTSASPEKAAMLANRIIQHYHESHIEQKREHASGEIARLGERLAELKNDMDRAERAVMEIVQQPLGNDGSTRGREADGQLRELEREAAATAAVHGSLLRRQKEMRDHQESIASDVRVLSLASAPNRPSSHNPILFVLPALVIFAVGGSLLAVMLEQLDRGMRSERDVNDALGILCIGLVPQLSRLRRFRPHRFLLKRPFSAYAEAVRSIVATLQLSAAPVVSKVVLVSSSVPREGKTTLAVSVAAYAASVGRRVLLVDLDFRHPSILPNLGCPTDKGVVDLLLEACPPKDVIQHVTDLGLDYIPMQRSRVDPIALLDRERLPHLLRQLRESYDCIVLDGPPLLGVTETRLLASMADKVLFVVKWGSTRRELAQSALNLLRDPGRSDKSCVDLPFAVVTQVDLKKHARYRYGDVGESLVKYSKHYARSIGR